MELDFAQFAEYTRAIESEFPALLLRLEAEAKAETIPVLRYESLALLRVLMQALKPEKILEIGTAIGYSSLWMAHELPETSQIVTLELSDTMADRAEANIREAGRQEQIQVRRGDAAELLQKMPEDSFDFIFLDAAKGQYIRWLPDILRLLRQGGTLLADNILQQGSYFKKREEIPHRDKTIYDRLHGFVQVLTHTEGLRTGLLSLGDGMTLTVKTGARPVPGDLLPQEEANILRNMMKKQEQTSPGEGKEPEHEHP